MAVELQLTYHCLNNQVIHSSKDAGAKPCELGSYWISSSYVSNTHSTVGSCVLRKNGCHGMVTVGSCVLRKNGCHGMVTRHWISVPNSSIVNFLHIPRDCEELGICR